MTLHVITGPPCAGKSTYAREHAHPERSVIVDLDALSTALGHPDEHPAYDDQTPARSAAHVARQSVLKATATGRIRAAEVWVIDSNATTAQYRGDTKMIELDPGPEVCHERATTQQRPPRTHAAIDAWYANRKGTTSRDW